LKKLLQAKQLEDVRKAIIYAKAKTIESYSLGAAGDERARRIIQEQDNITNFIEHIKENLNPSNIEETKTMAAQFISFHRARAKLYKKIPNYKKVE
jgi:hypothetical protein